ncbi:MAG: GntR family transcriptional regulator, partial [Candidatus Dormibacteraceae bacterium]
MSALLASGLGTLDLGGPEPLHSQITRQIRALIDSGALPPHCKLPSEPDLAALLGVSRGTVRRALRTLILDRMLVQVQGRGTFVAALLGAEQPIAQEMLSIAEALDQQGLPFRTEVLSVVQSAPPRRISALLGLRPGDPTVVLERRRSVNQEWVVVLRNYVPVERVPDLDRHDFTRETLFGVLEQVSGARLGWARRTFEAQGADARIARQLNVPLG